MIRAVAYPRYSSDNQREESITAQMRAIEEYCNAKGYVLVDMYPDEARSATTDNRPNFQRMIADSEKGLFDIVVVHKLDRFARDRYDSAHYKRILKKNGVRLESVLEQFDNTPESVILESVLEGMAEYYSKNLAREARKGMSENARKGKHNGGKPPYGYRVNPETMKLEIDEQAARAVRMYFEGVANGISLAQISSKLNELGYRTQTGRKFTKNSFDGWARNKKYIGIYTWDVRSPKNDDGVRSERSHKSPDKQTILEDAVPAIISVELFEKVNALMESRKRQGGAIGKKRVYLLSGKIFCGSCGSVYEGNSYQNRNFGVLAYYRCKNKCGNTSLRKEEIEQQVIQTIMDNVFTEEAMREVIDNVQRMYQEQKKNTQNELVPIKKEIAELQTKIDNWIEMLGSGIKSLADKIKEAENRKEILEYELQRMELIDRTPQLDEGYIRKVMTDIRDGMFSDDENKRKQVIQEFVDKIEIAPSDTPKQFDVKIWCRGFNGGGEAYPLEPLLTRYAS